MSSKEASFVRFEKRIVIEERELGRVLRQRDVQGDVEVRQLLQQRETALRKFCAEVSVIYYRFN